MDQPYKQFIFEQYEFDAASGTLQLHYGLDDAPHFTETYVFKFQPSTYDPAVLDRALQLLFFMAGVSYYKKFLPPEIVVKAGQIDPTTANLLSKTYQGGLGEFFYLNKLDPKMPITFPVNAAAATPVQHSGDGQLVAVGGGKDSLVSIELLRKDNQNLATWSVNHQPQLAPLVERIGLPHFWVERTWDPQLIALKQQSGSLSGHVPISAIFAIVGTIVAILSGHQDVVMSNEQSANEPTLHYQGVAINHQYSKSQAFERDYQQWLQANYGESVRYYSYLRPLSELRIAEIFAKVGFAKYRDVFSSCNRAFVHTNDHLFWCGTCAKCAFIFLVLTPFVPRDQLEALWGGKNLLLDPDLEPMYRKLLGIEGDKPLDCVGEIKECRAAMRMAFQTYPELQAKYQFELPDDYDFRTLASHEVPADIYEHYPLTTT